ncbi:hypothetical protein Tco_0509241 [Tanacetum coccineum]
MANLEKRFFHEGRVVSPNFENMSHIRAKFESIGFDCLLDINEQIVPCFVLEFYCQLTFIYNPKGQFVVNFVIQNKSFSLTLEEFGQILKIPFKGQASNTEMWSLNHLLVSVPSRGLYKTKPPSPRVIKSLIQVPRQGQETRTKNKKTVVVGDIRIISSAMLFKHVVSVSPELAFDHYLSHDRAMHPLAPHYERKTRADRGKKRPRESNASSSSTTQNHPSSSLPLDHMIDENDDKSFHSNSSSPSQQVSSSSNVAFQGTKRYHTVTPAYDYLTTPPVTIALLKVLIDQGIDESWLARDADDCRNGDDLENQVKFATCTLHSVALTWWNTHVKRVGHDAAYEETPLAYEMWESRDYMSDCPKLKNQNHGNQVGGTGARGMVHALGGGEINQDLNNMEDDINA